MIRLTPASIRRYSMPAPLTFHFTPTAATQRRRKICKSTWRVGQRSDQAPLVCSLRSLPDSSQPFRPPDDAAEFLMPITMEMPCADHYRSVDPDLELATSSPTTSAPTVNFGGVRDRCCDDCATRSRPICNTMSTARASGTRPAISDWRAKPTLMSNAHQYGRPALLCQHRQAAGYCLCIT